MRWSARYTSSPTVLTGGFAIADLSGDGVPEIVFATYATAAGQSHLIALHADGREAARVPLPGRGAMAVPTVADLDGDGTLEIVVNLKDGGEAGGVRVYTVPGSTGNCLPWPTGRANLRRRSAKSAPPSSPVRARLRTASMAVLQAPARMLASAMSTAIPPESRMKKRSRRLIFPRSCAAPRRASAFGARSRASKRGVG